jgi:hypothetical protein
VNIVREAPSGRSVASWLCLSCVNYFFPLGHFCCLARAERFRVQSWPGVRRSRSWSLALRCVHISSAGGWWHEGMPAILSPLSSVPGQSLLAGAGQFCTDRDGLAWRFFQPRGSAQRRSAPRPRRSMQHILIDFRQGFPPSCCRLDRAHGREKKAAATYFTGCIAAGHRSQPPTVHQTFRTIDNAARPPVCSRGNCIPHDRLSVPTGCRRIQPALATFASQWRLTCVGGRIFGGEALQQTI